MCHFGVSSDSGWYLLSALIVSLGHMVYFPKAVTLIHVAFVWEPAYACRYLMNFFMLDRSETFLMYFLLSSQLIWMVFLYLLFILGLSVTLPCPLVQHLRINLITLTQLFPTTFINILSLTVIISVLLRKLAYWLYYLFQPHTISVSWATYLYLTLCF